MGNTVEREKFPNYIFLRKYGASSTIQSAQLEYHSMQRANEAHSRIMAFLEVTVIITEVKIPFLLHIPPSMHLHLIFKIMWFLVKYFHYFQVLIFVVL